VGRETVQRVGAKKSAAAFRNGSRARKAAAPERYDLRHHILLRNEDRPCDNVHIEQKIVAAREEIVRDALASGHRYRFEDWTLNHSTSAGTK
jgi:predicted urease superfamily metal-dependent hydrolase